MKNFTKNFFGLLMFAVVMGSCVCDGCNKCSCDKIEAVSGADQNESKVVDGVDFDIKSLMADAKKARENAYCLYSNFKVGAAILTKSGKIYTGCNVENASYGLTICAERNAIFKAVSEGEKGNFIKAVAIVLDAPDYGAPCGACRQVINEFAEPDAVIVMGTVGGNYKVEKLENLLPYAFKFEPKLK
jgi:cytidine deaminase